MSHTHRVLMTGSGLHAGYAGSTAALIAGLEQGRPARTRQFFDNEDDARLVRLTFNPSYVPLPDASAGCRTTSVDMVERHLDKVIRQTLTQAQLPMTALQGPRVRVYVAGSGMRADLADFVGYQDRNDVDDLRFFPQIKQLCAASYGQDMLMRRLVDRYRLSWAPMPVYSASSSSMSAIHLGVRTIQSGTADTVLVTGWKQILLQDMLFLNGQNMLAAGEIQPFSMDHGGVMPADTAAAVLLESETALHARGHHAAVQLHGAATYQSSGARGNSTFSADFRSIAATFEHALAQAKLKPQDITCVFPHGSGMPVSDKAEAMAIQKIWGPHGVPVVSYKAQTGYYSSCSALVDLIIAADALIQGRLLASASTRSVSDVLQLDLHANRPAMQLAGAHLLKSAMGVDGSVVTCALSRLN